MGEGRGQGQGEGKQNVERVALLYVSTIGRHKASLDVKDKHGVTDMSESGVGLPWNGEQV